MGCALPGPQTVRWTFQTCVRAQGSAGVRDKRRRGSGRTSFWWSDEQKKRSMPALAHDEQRFLVGVPQTMQGSERMALMVEERAKSALEGSGERGGEVRRRSEGRPALGVRTNRGLAVRGE